MGRPRRANSSGPWPRVLLFGRLEVLLVRVDERLQRHSHVLCKVLSGWVELHHTTTSVVLGMPNDPWNQGRFNTRLGLPFKEITLLYYPMDLFEQLNPKKWCCIWSPSQDIFQHPLTSTCPRISSAAALFKPRRKGGLFFHISPVT